MHELRKEPVEVGPAVQNHVKNITLNAPDPHRQLYPVPTHPWSFSCYTTKPLTMTAGRDEMFD